jgi:hypothetical protein
VRADFFLKNAMEAALFPNEKITQDHFVGINKMVLFFGEIL